MKLLHGYAASLKANAYLADTWYMDAWSTGNPDIEIYTGKSAIREIKNYKTQCSKLFKPSGL